MVKTLLAAPLLSLLLAGAAQAQTLTYIRFVFDGPREFAGIKTNYYVDEAGKRLLNDNKAEVGQTRQWSPDTITIASARGASEPAQITFLNRRTGDFQTYTDGKQFESLKFGTCMKALIPVQKF